MTEEQVLSLLEKLIESDILSKLPNPASIGSGQLLFYVPLIALAVLMFRVFVVNGTIKKLLDFQECKAEVLADLLAEVKKLQAEGMKEQKEILARIQSLVQYLVDARQGGRRKTDPE